MSAATTTTGQVILIIVINISLINKKQEKKTVPVVIGYVKSSAKVKLPLINKRHRTGVTQNDIPGTGK